MNAPIDLRTAELVGVIAHHFEGATVDGDAVALGFGDVHLDCRVNAVHELGPELTMVSLFFLLRGGATGCPIFLSAAGYGRDARTALLAGAAEWACAFRAVLHEGFGDHPSAEPDQETPERLEIEIDGRTFDVTLKGLSRWLGSEPDEVDMLALLRQLGASPFLMPRLFASGLLPALDPELPTVISLFVQDAREGRVTEVKVNGADWTMAQVLFDACPRSAAPGVAMFRELAVLRPRAAQVRLTRGQVGRTLRGLAEPLSGAPRAMARWPGWTRHNGDLAPPMSEVDLDALEARVGLLPADYRHFLANVAERGAGPGYGLISPRGARQAALARGTFALVHEQAPDRDPSGVLALAHGGCASVWLLVLEGPHRGEVWVDASRFDGLARRVAPSFDAWYHRWLQAGVRDLPCWTQWDGGACAVPHLLSSTLDARPPALQDLAPRDYFAAHPLREMTLYARENPYFDAHTAIDACQSCAMLANELGVDPYVFTPGPALFGAAPPATHVVSSTQADVDDAPPRAPLWKRWLGLG